METVVYATLEFAERSMELTVIFVLQIVLHVSPSLILTCKNRVDLDV